LPSWWRRSALRPSKVDLGKGTPPDLTVCLLMALPDVLMHMQHIDSPVSPMPLFAWQPGIIHAVLVAHEDIRADRRDCG